MLVGGEDEHDTEKGEPPRSLIIVDSQTDFMLVRFSRDVTNVSCTSRAKPLSKAAVCFVCLRHFFCNIK